MSGKIRLHYYKEEPHKKNVLSYQDSEEIKPKKINKGYNISSSYPTYLHAAMENERKRIARELHDVLGNELMCINMDLLLLEEKIPNNISSIRNKIRPISKRLEKIVKMTQKMIGELRPELLDNLGLQAAMEWQASEFKKRVGIPCTINFDLIVKLSMELEILIFRVFQEALTNIMRHAKATRVTITITTNKKQLMMTINDNGKGITEKQINDSRSYGIIGMKERTSSLGGFLKIRGAKNKGTSLHVEIPLNVKTGSYLTRINH